MEKGWLSYPADLRDFRKQFATEEACRDYLIRCRWPDGFICPKCQHNHYWPRRQGHLFECAKCFYNASPTAGTILHRSRLPIQEWFWATYFVSTMTPGISATQLQRQIGIGSYRTAWFLLKRLRRAMVNDTRAPLQGLVEADETLVGGPAQGRKGRGVAKEPHVALVAGAVEVETFTNKKGKRVEKAVRLRLKTIKNADEKTIRSFLHRSVEKGSHIRTDGWRGYSKTALADYRHEVRIVGESKAHQLAPHIHRVFSNLKTWLHGTHHGVQPKYLQYYLDEFVFRFNRRRTPMAAFRTLLGIATQKKPARLDQIKQRDSSA